MRRDTPHSAAGSTGPGRHPMETLEGGSQAMPRAAWVVPVPPAHTEFGESSKDRGCSPDPRVGCLPSRSPHPLCRKPRATVDCGSIKLLFIRYHAGWRPSFLLHGLLNHSWAWARAGRQHGQQPGPPVQSMCSSVQRWNAGRQEWGAAPSRWRCSSAKGARPFRAPRGIPGCCEQPPSPVFKSGPSEPVVSYLFLN